jgi:hypothetical protein
MNTRGHLPQGTWLDSSSLSGADPNPGRTHSGIQYRQTRFHASDCASIHTDPVANILHSLRPNIPAHEDTYRSRPSVDSAMCEDSNLCSALRAFMRWSPSASTATAVSILFSLHLNILMRLRARIKRGYGWGAIVEMLPQRRRGRCEHRRAYILIRSYTDTLAS